MSETLETRRCARIRQRREMAAAATQSILNQSRVVAADAESIALTMGSEAEKCH